MIIPLNLDLTLLHFSNQLLLFIIQLLIDMDKRCVTNIARQRWRQLTLDSDF